MSRLAKKTKQLDESPMGPIPLVVPKVEEEIHPPILLGDIELSEKSNICEIMENMAQRRKKILGLEDEKKWTFDKCEDLFSFLKKGIFDIILRENVFISLDISDLFQTFCDYRLKYLEYYQKKETIFIVLYVTKMKYMAIQIIDEIIKELFHMEDEEVEDYDDSENATDDPVKQLYKQF